MKLLFTGFYHFYLCRFLVLTWEPKAVVPIAVFLLAHFNNSSLPYWEISLLTFSEPHQKSDILRWISFLLTALNGACSVLVWFGVLPTLKIRPKALCTLGACPTLSWNPSTVNSTSDTQQMPASHCSLLRCPACKYMDLFFTLSVNIKTTLKKKTLRNRVSFLWLWPKYLAEQFKQKNCVFWLTVWASSIHG